MDYEKEIKRLKTRMEGYEKLVHSMMDLINDQNKVIKKMAEALAVVLKKFVFILF